ncbi:phenazine biosynthesis-like domain-containing protein isoform X1 [Erythrolamprus reginae]|uniref:phenazine biosynthesis-like domain-containing protein isoform X1 n=1 Tax=Erythrolamprus reginae TaxID=121349 RepID=UPI00396CACE2
MQISVFIIDAFTNQPFRGNPAAVCLLEDELEEGCHQKIAAEMNLSETAFIRKLHPTDDFTKSSCFGLRWFTPTNEVPLCGHATLASAAVLFRKKNMNPTLTFKTLSGELKARQAGDEIILDLPLYVTYPQDFQEVEELVKAAVGDRNIQEVRYSPDTKKLLICLSEVYERYDLEKLKVDAQRLLLADKTGKIKGVIITVKGDHPKNQDSYDFYSRYFAPWNGISEDPVTGSAHAVLSSYWSQQLGKNKLCAFQCSSRGGELKILLRQDGRLDIGGQACFVLEGFLAV